MNGSIAFLTVKRDMYFIIEADLDVAGFRVVYCKNNLKHKKLLSGNKICLLVSTEKSWNALCSLTHTTHMQHYPSQILYFRAFPSIKTLVRELYMYFTNLRNFGFWGFSHDREYNIKYLCNIYA